MATNIEAATAGTPVKSVTKTVQFQALFDVIQVKVTLDEDSIAAQVGSQASVTVPGAAFGDFVLVAAGVGLGGLLFQGAVSAANTVQLTAYNIEGTDAVTTLSTAAIVNILVLKPKSGFAGN